MFVETLFRFGEFLARLVLAEAVATSADSCRLDGEDKVGVIGDLIVGIENSDGNIHNFYKAIIQRLEVKRFGLNATSRIKAFVFRFISVSAKCIRTSRRYVLNIYTCNNPYADVFQTDFG